MEKSCGIVIFSEENNKRKYLLLHYLEGHWDFPKGHVEKNENEHETALRELFEETGIKNVTFIDDFRERVEYSFSYKEKRISKEVFYFLAKLEHVNSIVISDEHTGFEWLSYSQAIKRITYQNTKCVLEKAEVYLSKWFCCTLCIFSYFYKMYSYNVFCGIT